MVMVTDANIVHADGRLFHTLGVTDTCVADTTTAVGIIAGNYKTQQILCETV